MLWLWYRGESFSGFQAQPSARTVQATLTEGLAKLGLEVGLMPAGRTDRGVHARMQVISVRVPADEDLATLPSRLESVLPQDLGVVLAAWAPKGFHAQWSATGKEYRYRMAPGALPSGWEPSAWRLEEEPRLQGQAPDPARLEEALGWMIGTRDFFAFHESSSPRKPRALHEASLRMHEQGAIWEVRLRGEGFGRYMVRYLVGAAVAYACGALEADILRAALEHATPFAGLKAPGPGLILWEVSYPGALEPFGIASGGTTLAARDRAQSAIPIGPPFAVSSDTASND